MKTSLECLAKADENDTLARGCPDGVLRDSYLNTAIGWRHIALLARQQEAWEEAHPDT